MNRSAKRFAVAALVLLAACRGHSPAERMRAIAPRAGRTIEARLTGFAWSPMRVQRASRAAAPLEPARLELAGAAGAVIEKTPGGHDAGVGYLVIDRDADAVEALQEAARKSSNDAKIWSDLAAATYTFAVRGDHAYELPRALAAVDRALSIDPTLAPALFNRALIIERLGVSEAARRAWQRYLQEDGTSRWSTEALEHLGRLRVVAIDDEFKRDLSRASAALRSGDAAPIGALTRNYPEQARRWGEGPLLADWADAYRAGDAAKAAQSLDLVRAIAQALAEWNREQLLADVVAAINAASPDGLRTLAEAQATYRDGRILYSRRRIAEAEPLLVRAAEGFSKAGSPMSFTAAYYVANAAYDSNRAADAAVRLEKIRSAIDPQRYRALTAHVLWSISLCEQVFGDWEAAIRNAQESDGIFTSLGETLNHGSIGLLLAWALDRAAQPRAAWTARVGAFAALSHGQTERIRGALGGTIRTESERGEYEAALALSNVALHDLRQDQQPQATQIFAHRARLFAAQGDGTAARMAINEAREAAARIVDGGMRERISVGIDIAEAIVRRGSDPKASLALLDRSLAFFTSRKEHAFLPDVLLQRGRTYATLGDDRAALADFEHGIDALDALRSRFEDSELRSGFYDSAADLFPEAIGLLLGRSEVERAFALADRARARSVSERLAHDDSSPPRIAASLGESATLLEYVILNDRLAIFGAGRGGISVQIVPVKAADLRRSVERLADLLQRRGDPAAIRRQSASLYAILIQPIAHRLAGAQRVVIVPDRHLHAVPFAALLNESTGRFLVEDFTLSVAPNAASRLRAAPSGGDVALIVGDPATPGESALPAANREAETIAAMYRSATILIGERATRSRFVDGARSCGIIHYAGHARSDTRSSFGSLRLAGDGDSPNGDLDARAIARMNLANAPLVVLAACGTMRGDADHVEGMPSVARAFLAAGARAVVGTLWEVDDDAAAEVFRRFHRQLSRGTSAAAALRAAQIELLRSGDPRLQHPSTWAPIEVLGGYEPSNPTPSALK